jgi:predicted MPP superfamily phosphohydrolase
MITFLTLFFFLYSLLHFYVFVRFRAALAPSPLAAIVLTLFMVVMIIAPLLVRVSESAGWTLLARVTAFVGFTWMGLLFLLVCVLIVTDVYRLVLYVLAFASGWDLPFLSLSLKSYFVVSLIAVAVIAVTGWFSARNIRVGHITIPTSKISPAVGRVRIVQISDVHLGLIVREDRLRRIMAKVKDARPDIFVSTGDLVDGQMNDLRGLAQLLGAVSPRYGKFAVTGNHEFYAGLDQALDFTRKAGFRVLRGEAVTIPGVINIVGVDDPAGPGYSSSPTGEGTLLSRVSNDEFTLFLKHRPDVDLESARLFGLQLSGHLHGGQLFPFRLIVRLFYPRIMGFYDLPKGSALYVSRGSGTWGPPIRFLTPPEVTIVDLVKAP